MIRNFENGDIVTSGKHFLTGKEKTRIAILCRLRLFLGEYFLDGTIGTPWFQAILGKASKSIAEANIKQAIISTPDVVSLTEFEFNFDAKTRKISIIASIIDINNEQFEFLFNEEII